MSNHYAILATLVIGISSLSAASRRAASVSILRGAARQADRIAVERTARSRWHGGAEEAPTWHYSGPSALITGPSTSVRLTPIHAQIVGAMSSSLAFPVSCCAWPLPHLVNRDLARRCGSGLSESRSLLGENVVPLAEAGRTIALEPVVAVHEVTAMRLGRAIGYCAMLIHGIV